MNRELTPARKGFVVYGLMALSAVALALICIGAFEVVQAVAAPKCASITKCRAVARWHHSIVVDRQIKTDIAYGRPEAGAALVPCHTLHECRVLVYHQTHAHTWAVKAWDHLLADNSVAGAERVVRYTFHPCGPTATSQAFSIIGWESGWQRYNINGAGDTSWWQYELPAHPDISVAQAEDIRWSSLRARRDSGCGRNWSPEWSSVRDHGMSWD